MCQGGRLALDPKKREQLWREAKQRCRLSAEAVRMAREMGLNPLSLMKNIPSPSQRWKAPVEQWVREMYAKRQATMARNAAAKAARAAGAADAVPRATPVTPSPVPAGSIPETTTLTHLPTPGESRRPQPAPLA